MKTDSLKIYLIYTFLLVLTACSKPTKCECKAELDKNMMQTAITGRAIVSDLNRKCDDVYNGASSYMNEKCPDK
jgi:hypothetical protein